MEPGWTIGDWTFLPRRCVLRRLGVERKIEPKAAAVLACLAESAGSVVTKRELFDAVWTGQAVTDEVLPNAVYQIRRAVQDDARRPRYVETIPKIGYRLVAPTSSLEGALEAPDVPRVSPRRRPRLLRVAARAAVLLAGVVTLEGHLHDGSRRLADPARPAVVAADLRAQGWDALDRALPGSGSEAAALARAALDRAPHDADGWALLASSWSARAAEGAVSAVEGHARALACANRAIGLDPVHTAALRARAAARWLGDWDWEGAEADLLAALELDPDDARTLVRLAELHLLMGRLELARSSAARAVDLSPTVVSVRLTAAMVESLAGAPVTAAEHHRAVLAIEPRHPLARRQLDKAESDTAERSPEETLARLASKPRVRPGHLAVWFAETGRLDRALDWLERAVAERDPTILFFRFDPRWDSLRDDPRYRAAMSTAGLGPRS